ncbi:MAG: hypothetical protein QXG00_07000 [Candidatus Woesearchaeota archaeon]
MKLVYQSCDRMGHEHLKDALETNKIKYKVEDDDAFKLSFRINKDEVADFQMNLANNILGAGIPGSFYIEQ